MERTKIGMTRQRGGDDVGQGSLFAVGPRGEIRPRDPHVTRAEAPRLSAQCSAILQRLRQGPATNVELATMALKYTSRLSDLRAAGYDVQVSERDHTTGRVVYVLASKPGTVA